MDYEALSTLPLKAYTARLSPIVPNRLLVGASSSSDIYEEIFHGRKMARFGKGMISIIQIFPETGALHLLRSFPVPFSEILAASWSGFKWTTTIAATGNADGTVQYWDTESDVLAPIYTLPAHESDVLSVDWGSSEDDDLLSASLDATIKRWRYGERNTTGIFSLEEDKGSPRKGFTSVSWAPRTPYIFGSGSLSRKATLWDTRMARAECVSRIHTGGVLSFSWDPEEKWVFATSDEQGNAVVWDTRMDDGPLSLMKTGGGKSSLSSKVIISRGSPKQLISTSQDVVSRWNWQQRVVVGEYMHAGRIGGLDLSADGTCVVSAGLDDGYLFLTEDPEAQGPPKYDP